MADAHPVVAVRLFGQLLASRGPVWESSCSDCAKAAALTQTGLRLINAETDDHTAMVQAGFRKLATAATVAELDLRQSDTVPDLLRAHGKMAQPNGGAHKTPQ